MPEDNTAEKEEPISEDNFTKPELLLLIHDELSKNQLHDSHAKMTTFLAACTAFLPDAKDRISVALLGDSSVGKDNIMHTTEIHLPPHKSLFLTRATQSTLEDDISPYPIILFSEQNTREGGANSELVEVVKQLSEGGASALKKDVNTGYRQPKMAKQEQKVIIYATTEARRDEETETRFICVSVSAPPAKIKAVNTRTCEKWAKIESEKAEDFSWIATGLEELAREPKYVKIPYAPLISDSIDNNNPRSMRDLKRVFKITAAMAWLHQKQRMQIKEGEHVYVVAEPVDFLNTVEIAGGFFQQSYIGIEKRLQELFDIAEKEYGKGKPFLRSDLQKKAHIVVNTMKARCKLLVEKGLFEYVDTDDNRKVKYQIPPISSGINNLSGLISRQALTGTLTGDLTGKIKADLKSKYAVISEGIEKTISICFVGDSEMKESTAPATKIDRSELTCQNSPRVLIESSEPTVPIESITVPVFSAVGKNTIASE